MLSSKGVKGQTLAAQGGQGGTETQDDGAAFCVTTGQTLRKVPVTFFSMAFVSHDQQ